MPPIRVPSRSGGPASRFCRCSFSRPQPPGAPSFRLYRKGGVSRAGATVVRTRVRPSPSQTLTQMKVPARRPILTHHRQPHTRLRPLLQPQRSLLPTHIRPHPSRMNRIHLDLRLPQLVRQVQRKRIQRRLRSIVSKRLGLHKSPTPPEPAAPANPAGSTHSQSVPPRSSVAAAAAPASPPPPQRNS